MTTFWVNDQVRATCTFTNLAGAVTDPTTVTFKAMAPAGTTTSYVYGTAAEVTKSSTGVFVLAVPVSSAGPWQFAAIGTGAVARSDVETITVRQRPGD